MMVMMMSHVMMVMMMSLVMIVMMMSVVIMSLVMMMSLGLMMSIVMMMMMMKTAERQSSPRLAARAPLCPRTYALFVTEGYLFNHNHYLLSVAEDYLFNHNYYLFNNHNYHFCLSQKIKRRINC